MAQLLFTDTQQNNANNSKNLKIINNELTNLFDLTKIMTTINNRS